jgi:hypothetical protein
VKSELVGHIAVVAVVVEQYQFSVALCDLLQIFNMLYR